MTNPAQKNLKVIKIVDPLLCVRCKNAYIADVLLANGTHKKMFYCSRLDCDNWVSPGSEAQQPEELGEAA